MLNFDDDDIFSGSPIDKWLEIIFHSHRGLAEAELRRLLESLALCEMLLDSQKSEEDWEKQVATMKFSEENHLQERMNNLAIESMGKILTQSE
ncbi:hypothetical protein CCZ01_04650 [Helicobacter monodelphidis]|uniref:DUF2018 family protein n=1 Tax=Helicobacter sp. 15-1451 TaxID=2004995 RepID=UPI000DCDA42A|nr:DUF2018 family protein [Helicobacter sp. 15-1451]RAX57922.1 hypothetical protein CCZ01_04650 [Helicobacter sp. 15-1451]